MSKNGWMAGEIPPKQTTVRPKRAGNEGLVAIPGAARPLKGHVSPGTQTSGLEKFKPAPQIGKGY
jgi:hypothetical protein